VLLKYIIGWLEEMNKWKTVNAKLVLFIFSLFFFVGCRSTPSPYPLQDTKIESILNTQATTENRILYLDSAISVGSSYIIGRLSSGTKVAIVNIQSPTVNLANYIIDTLSMYLVNEDRFFVIERSELGTIQKEQNYQLSGEVSDETAVSIGHQLGTQFIITGSILPLGEKYSLRLKIINVKTAQILGTKMYQVENDKILISLLDPPIAEIPVEQPKEKPPEKTPQTVINNTTITNNNETTINGDVFINKLNGFNLDDF
jgi:curli biogenesis system outer membrane secretion channel CsgG